MILEKKTDSPETVILRGGNNAPFSLIKIIFNNELFFLKKFDREIKGYKIHLPLSGRYNFVNLEVAKIMPLSRLVDFGLPKVDKSPLNLEKGVKYYPNQKKGGLASTNVHGYDVKIFTNEKFNNLSFIEKFFVLGHERGHCLYNKEEDCDLYSAQKLLNMGFNKDQIILAIKESLTCNKTNTKRIENLINKLHGQ